MAILTCFFLVLIIPYIASITFDFSNITQDNINLSGRANVSDEGIQVTPETRGPKLSKFAGRATYSKLLHLWDKSSGELASFDTEFSFVIDSNMDRDYADGLTFLLAENNTLITAGGALGLPIDAGNHSKMYEFVAVEFDTFWNNDWDPKDIPVYEKHVGIDVNSLVSVKYKQWMNNVSAGEECKAYIKYDSISKIISLLVYNKTGVVVVELSHIIDLRNVLPEWVIFGFSAATGDLFEKNTVKSWKFNSSNLRVDEEEVNSPTTRQNNISSTTASKNLEKGGNYTGFVVGIIAGVVIAFSTIIAFFLCRRKKKKPAEEVNERADC